MSARLAHKLGFEIPIGIQPRNYYLCLLGPAALGLSVGMQITVTAFLRLGPSNNPALAAQLTEYGKAIARPEHDLGIYAVCALLTLAAVIGAVWCWRAKVACVEAAEVAMTMRSSGLLQGVVAVTSLLGFLFLVSSCWFSSDFAAAGSPRRPPMGGFDFVRLLVPCGLALVCAAVDLRYGHGQPAGSASQLERRYLRIDTLLTYAVPAFIILVLGVPPGTWRYLAGQIFMADGCHHLDYFTMGPAISFTHGKAFGTEIYSQYGIGWPLLASVLSRFSALTYGNLLGLAIAYGCIYYVALFFVLRSCFKQEVWATFGVLLAICWQMFSGVGSGVVILMYPSSTFMRHPLDVWFFLALMMHQRSGRILWALLAGFAGALGIFFETETGVYLLMTFFVYSVLQAGLAPGENSAPGKRGCLLSPLAFYGTTAATLLPLLLYASRGTFITRAFWHGWLEALFTFTRQGVGALPIAELPDAPLMLFTVMVMLYLAVIAYAVIRGLHLGASNGEVLLAAVAAYGSALLVVFVSRSHPFNLCHETAPFAILLTALAFKGYKEIERRLPHSLLPYVLVGGLVLLLLTKPEFQCYPSFLKSIFVKSPVGGLSLSSPPPDLSGFPPAAEGFIREFQDTCLAIHTLAPDGKSVAILDLADAHLYRGANACPWSRYVPLLPMILTQKALSGIRDDLVGRSPRWVVIRGRNMARYPAFEFVWAPLYQTVTNRYMLRQTVGSYEIWQRANQP